MPSASTTVKHIESVDRIKSLEMLNFHTFPHCPLDISASRVSQLSKLYLFGGFQCKIMGDELVDLRS